MGRGATCVSRRASLFGAIAAALCRNAGQDCLRAFSRRDEVAFKHTCQHPRRIWRLNRATPPIGVILRVPTSAMPIARTHTTRTPTHHAHDAHHHGHGHTGTRARVRLCRDGATCVDVAGDASTARKLDVMCRMLTAKVATAPPKLYASRAVQFHPDGGQFDSVWLSARTPHCACVRVVSPTELIARKIPTRNILPLFNFPRAGSTDTPRTRPGPPAPQGKRKPLHPATPYYPSPGGNFHTRG